MTAIVHQSLAFLIGQGVLFTYRWAIFLPTFFPQVFLRTSQHLEPLWVQQISCYPCLLLYASFFLHIFEFLFPLLCVVNQSSSIKLQFSRNMILMFCGPPSTNSLIPNHFMILLPLKWSFSRRERKTKNTCPLNEHCILSFET